MHYKAFDKIQLVYDFKSSIIHIIYLMGTKQGCPLMSFLFDVTLEFLASTIKKKEGRGRGRKGGRGGKGERERGR